MLFKKAIEGDIIGFKEGDNGVTCNPLTWLLATEDNTEIIFMDLQKFADLWALQSVRIEQQIVFKVLEGTEWFQRLHTTTKYFLVFEALHEV